MAGKIGAKAIRHNPALKLFEPLVGEWQTTGYHPYFPDVELHGRVSCEWVEGRCVPDDALHGGPSKIPGRHRNTRQR